MLRVAVPNKGSLSEPAVEMLREAGYLDDRRPRDLVVVDPRNGVEFFFLRPRDIATYVGMGTLDVGITGRDLLLDSGSDADEVLALGLAPATFKLAVRPGIGADLASLEGKTVATSYTGLLAQYFADKGVNAKVVKLDGAVENAVRLGVADAVADVVVSGATMRQAGLEILPEAILESEALLIRRKGAPEDVAVTQLLRRLEGVIVARSYVMMDYDIQNDLVDQACALTPGIESPTVSPLREQGWAAVRSMVPRTQAHIVMDELWELGARGIIVTDIHACRI